MAKYLVLAGLLACCACNLILARAVIPNSDMVQNIPELIAVLHGNIFLNHWILGADNYYFTDLPFFVIMGVVFGPMHWLTVVQPVIVYTLLLFAAMLLVQRARPPDLPSWPGALAILLMIGMPFTLARQMFLVPAFHAGTIMLCLYALLILQPILSGNRIHRLLFLPFFLLSFAAVTSDPMAYAFFAIPLLALLLLRLWLYRVFRLDEAITFALTLLAVGAGTIWPGFTASHGGFIVNANYFLGFVPDQPHLMSNFRGLLVGVLYWFDASPEILPPIFGAHILAVTRFACLLIVLGACMMVIWNMPRAQNDGLVQFLVLGALCLLVANLISINFYNYDQGNSTHLPVIRYIAPACLFFVIAGVIQLQNYMPHLVLRPVLLRIAVSFGIVFGLVFILCAAQQVAKAVLLPTGYQAAPSYALTQWLLARHYSYGGSDYWNANMITAGSDGKVMTDALLGIDTGVQFFPLNTDMSRFLAKRRPQFVAIMKDNLSRVTFARVVETYGPPAELDHLGNFTIFITQGAMP
jgi:hypothetical protein